MSLIKKLKRRFSSVVKNSGNNIFLFSEKMAFPHQINCSGNGNRIQTGESFRCKKCIVDIRGNNNSIVIGNNFECSGIVVISIIGNGNQIVLGDDVRVIERLSIYNQQNCQSGSLSIGKGCSFYLTELHLYDNASSIEIGDDCIFAYNTVVHNTDGHSIFEKGKLVNQAKECVIGSHVWIARNALILKNSKIPDGCIVAANSVITKKFLEKNAVIASSGILKKGIIWDRRSVNEVLAEQSVLRGK